MSRGKRRESQADRETGGFSNDAAPPITAERHAEVTADFQAEHERAKAGDPMEPTQDQRENSGGEPGGVARNEIEQPSRPVDPYELTPEIADVLRQVGDATKREEYEKIGVSIGPEKNSFVDESPETKLIKRTAMALRASSSLESGRGGNSATMGRPSVVTVPIAKDARKDLVARREIEAHPQNGGDFVAIAKAVSCLCAAKVGPRLEHALREVITDLTEGRVDAAIRLRLGIIAEVARDEKIKQALEALS